MLLDSLNGARWFTTLDVFSGFYNIEIDECDRDKTAFVVPGSPGGLYRFKRMPYGLCNAPATFCRVMDTLFGDLIYKFVLIYIDDFIIYSRSFEEHLEHVRVVLERLATAGLKVKLKKCFFAQSEVEFLGHLVSAAGISSSPQKVDAIFRMVAPTSVRGVRTFLGMTSYYRRYIFRYASVAEPLNALLKKDTPFQWNDVHQRSFNELKRLLCEAPIMSHFDPELPVEIHTDASAYGVGAVCVQRQNGEERVIAYASKTLNKAQRNYGATELEVLAVVFGIEKFRYYALNNMQFKVVTDHSAISALLRTKYPDGRLAR